MNFLNNYFQCFSCCFFWDEKGILAKIYVLPISVNGIKCNIRNLKTYIEWDKYLLLGYIDCNYNTTYNKQNRSSIY